MQVDMNNVSNDIKILQDIKFIANHFKQHISVISYELIKHNLIHKFILDRDKKIISNEKRLKFGLVHNDVKIKIIINKDTNSNKIKYKSVFEENDRLIIRETVKINNSFDDFVNELINLLKTELITAKHYIKNV